MSANDDHKKYSGKEQGEIKELQETIKSHGSSNLQKEIAQAKLDDMEASKQPPAHMHKHRIQGESEEAGGVDRSNANIFHNDEAFERFEMGGEKPSGKKPLEGAAEWRSIKMNHKAPGGAKRKAGERLERDDDESVPSF
ncbi:hypothetical protein B0H34DRAFT_861273 [Crassisporium funariophilum]|nr:hypothetical protein B0H34DRAFT_861273 [Crassisporium funariophilum]